MYDLTPRQIDLLGAERVPVPDKRVTIDDVVAEVRDGMTVGIGGWGSRRKPMAIVRALLRSPVKDLTVVAYGGPDVGLLCRAGKVRRVVESTLSWVGQTRRLKVRYHKLPAMHRAFHFLQLARICCKVLQRDY